MILTDRQRQIQSRKPLNRANSSFLPITQKSGSTPTKVKLEGRESRWRDDALRCSREADEAAEKAPRTGQ